MPSKKHREGGKRRRLTQEKKIWPKVECKIKKINRKIITKIRAATIRICVVLYLKFVDFKIKVCELRTKHGRSAFVAWS